MITEVEFVGTFTGTIMFWLGVAVGWWWRGKRQ